MSKIKSVLDDITGLSEERDKHAITRVERDSMRKNYTHLKEAYDEIVNEKYTVSKELDEFRAEAARLQGAIQYLVEEAYWEGPMSITPDVLLGQLGELDSQLVDELVNLRQWDVLGGLASNFYADSEYARKRSVDDSRYMYVYNPLVDWMIKTWTNYGLGDSVSVSVNNTEGNDIFQEFWEATRNQAVLGDDQLQYLSIFTLQDGNTFLACFISKVDGLVTVEEIPVDEITDIITNPERKSEKLFYERTYETSGGNTETIYYPDWSAKISGKLTDELAAKVLDDGTKRADIKDMGDITLNDIENKAGTDVVVLHIAHNRKSRKSHWGWPLLSSTAYVKAHKRFMENRLTVADAKAMFVRRKQVTGGSRAAKGVRSAIGSTLSRSNFVDRNPPSPAGGVEIDNKAIDTKDLPMTTGASDAKNDHEMFSWMALLQGGLFQTTAGLDTQRWATALTMDKTLSMQWSRYQTFWSTQFKNLVTIVLWAAEEYGSQSFTDEDGATDYTSIVSIDTLSLVDFSEIVDSLSGAVDSMLKPFMADGTIPEQTGKAILRELWLIMMQALGLSSSKDIASKDAFEIIDEASSLPAYARALRREFQKIITEYMKTAEE